MGLVSRECKKAMLLEDRKATVSREQWEGLETMIGMWNDEKLAHEWFKYNERIKGHMTTSMRGESSQEGRLPEGVVRSGSVETRSLFLWNHEKEKKRRQ